MNYTHPVFALDTVKVVQETEDTTEIEFTEAWKEWRTVENHSFGKDRGNLAMIADLRSLHPYFRDKISLLIQKCKAKGITLDIVESYRTRAKQSEYYSMGRKYTRSTGGKSKHQYGLAVDLVPIVKGLAVWDNDVLWKKIGVEGEKLGLRWGGRWKSPYDPAHFEWTAGLTTYQLAAGYLPKIPVTASADYPCLEADVHELKKHWEVYEDLQSAIVRRNKRQPRLTASRLTP